MTKNTTLRRFALGDKIIIGSLIIFVIAMMIDIDSFFCLFALLIIAITSPDERIFFTRERYNHHKRNLQITIYEIGEALGPTYYKRWEFWVPVGSGVALISMYSTWAYYNIEEGQTLLDQYPLFIPGIVFFFIFSIVPVWIMIRYIKMKQNDPL